MVNVGRYTIHGCYGPWVSETQRTRSSSGEVRDKVPIVLPSKFCTTLFLFFYDFGGNAKKSCLPPKMMISQKEFPSFFGTVRFNDCLPTETKM